VNIYEALQSVSYKKRQYFLWKHDINWDRRKPPKSEVDFMRSVGAKTMNGFIAFEKTEDYRRLMAIYLNTRFDNDLAQIYDSLSEKAKDGDEKSVKLLLQLGKDIKQYAKEAAREFSAVDDQEEDDLEV